MDSKNNNTLPLFEELFEKRGRLCILRKKVIDARSRNQRCEVDNMTIDSEPTNTAPSVSTTCNRSPKNTIDDGEQETFDYSSDDSVKDKNYVPDENDSLNCSEISNSPDSMPTKRRKDLVKRCIFSPEKFNNNPDTFNKGRCKVPEKRRISQLVENPTKAGIGAENNFKLITLQDLLGSQNKCDEKLDFFTEFDKCLLSPPRKKPCLANSIVHINEIGNLSDDSDIAHSNETRFTSLTPDRSNAVVCYSNFSNTITPDLSMVTSSKSCSSYLSPNSVTNPMMVVTSSRLLNLNRNVNPNDQLSYEVMTVDCNGIIYLPSTSDVTNNESTNNEGHVRESIGLSGTQTVKKKISDPKIWKRNASKIARLKGSPYHSTVAKKRPDVDGRILKPPCFCKAKCYIKIPCEKRLLIFNQFWKKCYSWDQRRQFIANNVKKETKRLMKTDGDLETDRRKFSYIYKLTVDFMDERVCKVMFLNTLSIGEKFVKVSIEKQLQGGLTLGDQRGKHVPANKSPEPMIKTVIDHINSYPSYESHYSRQKSGRKFLGPDLNITTMYKHYKELMVNEETPANLIAKEWLYRYTLNTKFNLSFKLPSVDTCDDCDAYQRKLQDARDDTEKEKNEKEREVHGKAADERYKLKKEDKDEAQDSSGKKKVLMFDLQKCLATPNLTNTKSFYLRKLWTLNLTIHDGTSNVATNMIWSENVSGRGGNEIASCLIRWAEENSSKIATSEELTFWSDNCAGQNRNLMIVMAYIWLLHKLPQLKVINHKFMLKGHTHMEVDQIHSQIERKKNHLKTMQIAIPRDWSQFIRTCGGKKTFEVFDMELRHFKDVTTLFKKRGSLVARKKNKDGKEFKISECVWLQLKQEQPGVLFYKNTFSEEFSEISLVRNSKGVEFPDNLPNLRQEEKPISTAKYNDLITLLQWVPTEFHAYYRNLKHGTNEPDFPETE